MGVWVINNVGDPEKFVNPVPRRGGGGGGGGGISRLFSTYPLTHS